jgi:hypothetical protein
MAWNTVSSMAGTVGAGDWSTQQELGMKVKWRNLVALGSQAMQKEKRGIAL